MHTSPQFQRTDKAILQAMVSLLKKKPFEKITVQDILDETPVTRATFYAHYHDKYDVVEKMLEQFLASHGVDHDKILGDFPEHFRENVRASYLVNREYAQALLSVHTDRVDFSQAIIGIYRDQYLSDHDSITAKAEARVYAAARAALYMSFLREEITDFSFEQINHVLISAVLALFDLPEDDNETRRFLRRKILQRATEHQNTKSDSGS